MLSTPTRLAQGVIPTAETSMFAAAFRTTVNEIILCNTTNAPITVSVSIVPNGQVAGDDNRIIDTMEIPVGQPVIADMAQVLNAAGDFISAIASGAGVTMTISGIVIE